MKVGMNLLLWTTHLTDAHAPLLEQLQATGFDGVEVFVGEGDEAQFARLGSLLDSLGLERTTVVAVNPDSNPISPDSKVRQAAIDQLKQAVDKSSNIGSQMLCGPFHSALGAFTGQPPQSHELAWSAEVLRAVAEHASPAGIQLSIEPLNRFDCYLINTVEQARELIRLIDHPGVGILYDTHHAHIEEKDPSAAIQSAAAEINHVHISESDRGTPGRGQVHWERTFQALRAIGYDGWLIVESFSRTDPEFASLVHIWRELTPSLEQVYQEGFALVQKLWGAQA